MKRLIMSKERQQQQQYQQQHQQLQTYRDHKALQIRFDRQESLLRALQQENKALLLRIRQYEHCLDDVMRKVVDALVAEDNLREDVVILKSRVQDLELQNAALSTNNSFKGRDEGYCTMGNDQMQPFNGHFRNLTEEPEQWLLPAEPCPIEMEDWSMSQEELAVITLNENDFDLQFPKQQAQQQLQQQQVEKGPEEQSSENQVAIRSLSIGDGECDWNWNQNGNSNNLIIQKPITETDSVIDHVSQQLQQKIIPNLDDEEVALSKFTNDFYKLVNIHSTSVGSLCSYIEDDNVDEVDDHSNDDDYNLTPNQKTLSGKMLKARSKVISPTASEAGRAQIASCSSSETDDLSQCTATCATNIVTQYQQQQQQQYQQQSQDLIYNLRYSKSDMTKSLSASEIENVQDLKKQPFKVQIKNIEYDNDGSEDDQRYNTFVREHNKEKIINDTSALSSSSSSSIMKKCSDKVQLQFTEAEYIEQIIRKEFNRLPRHKLLKSQSNVEDTMQQCQWYEKSNVKNRGTQSGCTNRNFLINRNNKPIDNSMNWDEEEKATVTATNLWRRCKGWKRIDSPLHSPNPYLVSNHKTESQCKTVCKLLKHKSKIPTTRTPSSHNMNVDNVVDTAPISPSCLHPEPIKNQLQGALALMSASISTVPTAAPTASGALTAASVVITSATRKSKIPPPVFVRRSYVSSIPL